MNIFTETSHHDDSRDDKEKFDATYESIWGKAWYEKDEKLKESK